MRAAGGWREGDLEQTLLPRQMPVRDTSRRGGEEGEDFRHFIDNHWGIVCRSDATSARPTRAVRLMASARCLERRNVEKETTGLI